MSLAPALSDLTAEETALIEAAAEFARTELLAVDRACDADESPVTSLLPRLSEMGFLNLCLPEEVNGIGCRYAVYAAIMHEIAAWAPSVCVTLLVHNMVGSVLNRYLPDPSRREWLGQFGKPESLAAFAITEAGAGSDSAGVKTTADKAEGGFRLTGEKMWITNGITARWFLVLARLQHAGQGSEFCAFIVDGNRRGVERTKMIGKMGIRGSETAVIHFSDVFVPFDHVLGEPGKGRQVFLSSLNVGRIGIASQATGIAEACLREMVTYARQREQFGQPIGTFQAVANMIGESFMELEAAKALVWRAAQTVDAGNTDRTASSMAKLFATESANRIAYRAVQVHGGTGYVRECRVEQLYRDARVTTIYEGTSEIQRLVIADELRPLSV